MDARVVSDKGTDDNTLMVVKPRRFSKSQRKVMLFPFEVVGEDGKKMSDQGYIVLDVRTGTLTVEHRLEEVPIETEPKKTEKPDA
jgi:hypothetical protein